MSRLNPKPRPALPCTHPGCLTVGRRVRGLCRKHYTRWARYGDPDAYIGTGHGARTSMTLVDQIVAQLPTDECVLWVGAMVRRGYGLSSWKGTRMVAHRAVYLAVHGSIPEGMQLDHLCRTKACVNPAHLEPVTGFENVARWRETRMDFNPRTHCHRGHEWADATTYVTPSGRRACRVCVRINRAAWRQRRREAQLGKAA